MRKWEGDDRMKFIKKYCNGILLGLILVLAAFLSFYGVWNEGYGNEFYAASVKSMLMSWHSFFFASLDPAGFVTVDKPPVALWVQTLSAKIFGFHGWSLILPESVAAVVSVCILYYLVRRKFGNAAGLISALTLAVTPIFIAVSKTNNLDSVLIVTLMFSAWALLKAAETGRLRFLLLSLGLVGVGFNIKTLEAYLVLPAFYLTYFFAARAGWKRRIRQLAVSTVLLVAVSFSWSLIVDAIPAGNRPYVDNSTDNSEIQLALGYNGIQRLTGKVSFGGRGGSLNVHGLSGVEGSRQNGTDGFDGYGNTGKTGSRVMREYSGDGRGGQFGGMSLSEGGQKGVLRMFNSQMAGQASWLLVFALFAIAALLIGLIAGRKEKTDSWYDRLRALLLWGGWVLVICAYFSIAGFFHRYYLSTLAPGIAALTGIGFSEMYKMGRQRGIKAAKLLLPTAIIASLAEQCVVLFRYPVWAKVLVPIVCVFGGLPVLFYLVNVAKGGRLKLLT